MKKILFIFLFFCNICFGQSVKYTYNVGSNLYGGNTNYFLLSNQLNVGNDDWSLNPQITYSEQKNDDGWSLEQREFYCNANYNYQYNKISFILFSEGENSFLKEIKLRTSFGGGIGGYLIKKDKFEIFLSECLIPETYYTELSPDKDLNSLRSSTKLKLKHSIGFFKFTSNSLIQPALSSNKEVDFMDNLNIRSNNTIEVPFSKIISLGLQMNCFISTYSHFINKNVKPYDWNMQLMVSFKNY
ncbi:DUF481 domain-containing protein [bacterium]|nr:DUF481 domain-containing protein [bacterium]